MRLVIAGTGPIRYLIQIGHVDLLSSLFESVSIPTVVAQERGDSSAPATVQAWINAPPLWLKVLEAKAINDPALQTLDPGERSAIELGISLKAELILIDERKGRLVARSKGFETTGILGILDLASKRGLIDLKDAMERLKQTNFRYKQELIDGLLAQTNDRYDRCLSVRPPSLPHLAREGACWEFKKRRFLQYRKRRIVTDACPMLAVKGNGLSPIPESCELAPRWEEALDLAPFSRCGFADGRLV